MHFRNKADFQKIKAKPAAITKEMEQNHRENTRIKGVISEIKKNIQANSLQHMKIALDSDFTATAKQPSS